MKQFEKVLKLAQKHAYFNLNPTTNSIDIQSTGLLLLQNIKNEFVNHILNKTIPFFYSSDLLTQTTFDFAYRQMCAETLPFGILFETTRENSNENHGFNKLLNNNLKTVLKSYIYVEKDQGLNTFHTVQKERRIWYRKFSASPSRYKLNDALKDTTLSEITAKYPWGTEVIETIFFKPENTAQNFSTIKIETCLQNLVLNTVSDAYDDKLKILHLHRKLAPYKIAFTISNSKKSNEDLKDLMLYLAKQLKSQNISTLLLPISYKYTLKAQHELYDQLGVPFCVNINEKSLKNGIVLLRNRETTLDEQVHIVDLQKYIEKLLK